MTCDDAPLFCDPWRGENERVAPMKVVKVPLKKVTSNFKEAFRRCPTICFPTIPPCGALERDSKQLAKAIEDWERSCP